jgi:hypothetical protein
VAAGEGFAQLRQYVCIECAPGSAHGGDFGEEVRRQPGKGQTPGGIKFILRNYRKLLEILRKIGIIDRFSKEAISRSVEWKT